MRRKRRRRDSRMDRITEPTLEQLRLGRILPGVVLASYSPNRRKLLEECGIDVRTFTPDADESTEGMDTEEAMKKNARVKMEAYISSPSFLPAAPALSADTLVRIDGALLGKPKDREDAGKMLRHLSGRVQKVYTGCSLYIPGKSEIITFCDTAAVLFHSLSNEAIEAYLDTEEWKGAAGGYRLQKTGYTLVERIDGDWATVVGLPLMKILSLLQPKSSS